MCLQVCGVTSLVLFYFHGFKVGKMLTLAMRGWSSPGGLVALISTLLLQGELNIAVSDL